ncbi:MAG: lipopolysaccharide transport periplasmic protein LptA [Pseudomonadota bacterium]
MFRQIVNSLALCCIAWVGWAQAAPTPEPVPIQLSADSVALNEGQSIYRGQVDLRQGNMQILADQITVQHDAQQQPSRLIARGTPVRFRQKTASGWIQAQAQRADYLVQSAQLTLSGEVVLRQAGDVMQSDRVIYDRRRQILKAGGAAAGKQRVQMTLQATE